MTRWITVLAVLLSLAVVGAASAQEEAHYEGYTYGSNPSLAGTELKGRGLVTALYPPLVSNFVVNEYTWVIDRLYSNGSVLTDSVYNTSHAAGNASRFRIWEDKQINARPTFYFCPSDIIGDDIRYEDGALYLQGHFIYYKSTFDIHTDSYGMGTFVAQLNWDTGTHVNDLPLNKRGGWTFGGSTTSAFACIPPKYEQAMTGRIFQLTTGVTESTWGQLRKAYR